ncbi:hypothetical protein [Halosimplex sp. TS25]|uniref:hypothetical protein n=1 Tax=Halosimplex rarum TaxID=3396619 RepID=UPI0039EA69EE
MAVDADESPSSDSHDSPQRSLTALGSLRSAFSLQIAALGAVFIAIGFALNTGVWAGMLPIWGFALVLIGVGAYAFTHLSQRGTKG